MNTKELATPGWRGRIGLIYMHSSIVMESEFNEMSPQGVSVHTTRIVLPKADLQGLTRLGESEEIERCTALLCAAPINVVIFGGTSASFIKGLGWDESIVNRMEAHSNGITATTTSTASVRALKRVNAKRIAIATPYVDEVNERARVFFSENGFEVTDMRGLQLDDDHAIGYTSLEEVYRLGRSLDVAGADALFISCTNLQTIGVIEALEQDLGVPVVTAIQASFWDCLRISGVATDVVSGYGSLFAS